METYFEPKQLASMIVINNCPYGAVKRYTELFQIEGAEDYGFFYGKAKNKIFILSGEHKAVAAYYLEIQISGFELSLDHTWTDERIENYIKNRTTLLENVNMLIKSKGHF